MRTKIGVLNVLGRPGLYFLILAVDFAILIDNIIFNRNARGKNDRNKNSHRLRRDSRGFNVCPVLVELRPGQDGLPLRHPDQQLL